MNITDTETPSLVVAKVYGAKEKSFEKKKITYSVDEAYPNLSLDKKDITLSELNACER